MKVFVVEHYIAAEASFEDDWHDTEGVFSTLDKAKAFVESLGDYKDFVWHEKSRKFAWYKNESVTYPSAWVAIDEWEVDA